MDDKGMTGVALAIPKTLIEDTIRAEIVRQLGDRTDLLDRVIKTALNQKSTDERYRYSHGETPTVFQHAVTTMIQDTAKEIFKEWLEQHRKDIAAALVKHLNESKAARLKKLAAELADGMNLWRVGVSLTIQAKE